MEGPSVAEPISLASVTKTYPGAAVPALKSVSLDVAPGERVLITGAGGLGIHAVQIARAVGAFVIAAVLTPPDVISQMSLALPLLVLYEGSIIAVRIVEKKAAARAASTPPSASPPPPAANPAE